MACFVRGSTEAGRRDDCQQRPRLFTFHLIRRITHLLKVTNVNAASCKLVPGTPEKWVKPSCLQKGLSCIHFVAL